MKLNAKFITHESLGEHYIIGTDETGFKGIVKSNETAAFIVECLKTDTTEEAIVDRLAEEYEVADRATVERDVAAIISKLRSIGALEE
jgi:Coenzyme PQQ synthesis protein D (PqqD).